MSAGAQSAERAKSRRTMILVAFAAVYVLWGSTYLAIRYAVQTLPPFTMAGVRFLIAGALLSGWALMNGADRPTRANWRATAIVGTLLFPCGNGIVVWAETRIPSGIAALLVATVPVWVVLLPWLRGGTRPRSLVLVGTVLGICGVSVLVSAGFSGRGSIDPLASLALVAASIAWASGSLYARNAPLPGAPLLAAGMEMAIGGAILIVIGLLGGEWGRVHASSISGHSIVAFVYLVTFGSLVGFTAYSWLVGTVVPARVSTYAFVNPVVAVFLGWLVAGEAITPRVLLASTIIIGAVAAIVLGQQPRVQRVQRVQRA